MAGGFDLSGTTMLGAPPECPQRPYCLIGLRAIYGMQFAGFVPMPTRAATVEALLSGEVGVGMLETTYPGTARAGLILLDDDLGLQPRENVVPLVRTAVLGRLGGPGLAAIDRVSAALTTADLVALNESVVVDGRPPAEVAVGWLNEHGT